MDENTYTVYMHTTPDGKRYVGVTVMDTKERWRSGAGYNNNQQFHSAIVEFGWKNIRHEIVASGLNMGDACDLERDLVDFYDTTNPEKGFNVLRGGSTHAPGYRHTEDAKRKIGDASRGRVKSEETRKRLSEALTGKKRSKEFRKYLSDLRKATPLTDAQKDALDSGRPQRRPVWCDETQMFYKSQHDAADALGISRANLKRHLDGKYKQCNGYHCRWATEEEYLEQGA